METVNCLKCGYRHPDNGNCTAIGGFCTAVPAAHCQLLHDYLDVGLMPDQVANAKVIIESAFAEDTSKAERIRELLKADAEGRVVVLEHPKRIHTNADRIRAEIQDDRKLAYLTIKSKNVFVRTGGYHEIMYVCSDGRVSDDWSFALNYEVAWLRKPETEEEEAWKD